MDCPMRVGSAGYMYGCKKEECAWWNEYREECIIKTFIRSAEHKTVTIKRDDWGKDI